MAYTLKQALEAASASMFRVTDGLELEAIKEPLELYKAKCPYIEFRNDPTEATPFLSESAQVLTKAKDRNLYQVRRFERKDRRTLTAQALPLSAYGQVSDLDPRFPAANLEDQIGLPDSIGTMLAEVVESNVLRCLEGATNDGGRVIQGDKREIKRLVEQAVGKIDRECTVICNYMDLHHLQEPFGDEIGTLGNLKPSRVIREGVVLVVANWPQKVGFVRTEVDTQVFVQVKNVCDACPTAMVKYAFCVWGDAPAIKVDVRENKAP